MTPLTSLTSVFNDVAVVSNLSPRQLLQKLYVKHQFLKDPDEIATEALYQNDLEVVIALLKDPVDRPKGVLEVIAV